MAIFFKKSRTPEKEPSPVEPQTNVPVFELANNLYENQKLALIAWIANALERNTDSLTLEQASEIADCVVSLAEQGEDVYLELKTMELTERDFRSVLEQYEAIKSDIGKYLPIRDSSQSIDTAETDPLWKVYRDVIYAATQGRFVMIMPQEAEGFKNGNLLGSAPIRERPDIPKARDLAKQLLLNIGIPQTMIMSYLLVVSEAVTNILKHAEEGMMHVFETDSKIRIVVEDKGPGFPLEMIPKTTLMEGYSTKRSMGQGFTLMMKMTERTLLSTIPGVGSTLILEFDRKEAQKSHEPSFRG